MNWGTYLTRGVPSAPTFSLQIANGVLSSQAVDGCGAASLADYVRDHGWALVEFDVYEAADSVVKNVAFFPIPV